MVVLQESDCLISHLNFPKESAILIDFEAGWSTEELGGLYYQPGAVSGKGNLSPGAHFAKVPKLLVSKFPLYQERRGFKSSNFTVIFLFAFYAVCIVWDKFASNLKKNKQYQFSKVLKPYLLSEQHS